LRLYAQAQQLLAAALPQGVGDIGIKARLHHADMQALAIEQRSAGCTLFSVLHKNPFAFEYFDSCSGSFGGLKGQKHAKNTVENQAALSL